MNNPSQSTHWTHRAASIFQIIFGIVGFIADLCTRMAFAEQTKLEQLRNLQNAPTAGSAQTKRVLRLILHEFYLSK